MDYIHQLSHPVSVRMLTECTRLPGARYGGAFFIMFQVVPNQLHTLLTVTIGDEFLAGFEHVTQIFLPISDKESSDTGCFE